MAGEVTNDPALVAKLVKVFSRGPTQDLITNLNVKMEVFTAEGTDFPLTISDPPNCYICSPSTAYIDYGLEETRHFTANPALRGILSALIKACRPLLRATGLDHQVQVNNWLFSTNPVPQITPAMASAIRNQLTLTYPTRTIIIRSLNDTANKDSIAALKDAGFLMLPARQIYLVDPALDKPPSADMKRDATLLAETDYVQVDAHEFSASDWTRAAMLYHMLYADRYTGLNPQYTPGCLAQAHQIGLLRIVGLRGADDLLDGVVGMFTNGKTMTVPLIGYDTGKRQDIGLYRMLNAIAQRHATEHGLFYNLSAGAADFKRHRNAEPAIEYSAVYIGHLGLRSRVATRIIRKVLTGVGVPVMRRFRL